jgi:high-affinity nickel-transport protein
MSIVPADALGLAALVFLLGLRHGFDPDHLVAIDGLTRASRSRWSGLFFSLGHGAVVTLVGLAVALAAGDWRAPVWLEELGVIISISVLLTLGIANLLAVWRARPDERPAPVGLRGRWLSGWLGQASHPLMVAGVGAAFALSFDTISHALLFSVTGASLAGWAFALALGGVFTLGMVLTDALNGWWVAKLIAGADARAARASRVMSLAIAFLCLALVLGTLAQYAVPKAALSLASLAVLAMAYLVANRWAKSARNI